jgi:hypothetical protein
MPREDWSVRIAAHPRAADARGPGQFTVGSRSAGQVHIGTVEGMEEAVRSQLRQHAGMTGPLVLVLDLSSPIISDREIAAVLRPAPACTSTCRMTCANAVW